jgi:hypothetical protein
MIPTLRPGAIALAILFASSPCLAQTDAENIRSRVMDGQKVSVTDDGGQVFGGRISAITADGLRIQVGKTTADVRFDRIVRIDRPNDGLANGALIGFGVGAATGLALMVAEDNRDCDPLAWFDCSNPTAGGYAVATLVGAGLGAAIGVGVDALIYRQREIYRRTGGAQPTITPVLGPGVRGALVTLTW